MMKQLRRTIISKTESRTSDLVICLIAAAGLLSSPVKHRLYWRFCNVLGGLIRGKGSYITLALSNDSQMKVFLDDPYWSRLIAASYRYEPDFQSALLALKDLDYVFLDCGANFGYWSILVSGEGLGKKRAVAVEASCETYKILAENCALNGNRFQCLYYALSSETGRQVVMEATSGHAGAHIAENPGGVGVAVNTITLDDLAETAFGGIPVRVLVKLDVEGQEINSFQAAAKLLEQDVLFYYEDHGRDPDSHVTQYLLDDMGLNVWFLPENGPWVEICTAAEASRYKKRKRYGYNFFACKPDSEFLKKFAGTGHKPLNAIPRAHN